MCEGLGSNFEVTLKKLQSFFDFFMKSLVKKNNLQYVLGFAQHMFDMYWVCPAYV